VEAKTIYLEPYPPTSIFTKFNVRAQILIGLLWISSALFSIWEGHYSSLTAFLLGVGSVQVIVYVLIVPFSQWWMKKKGRRRMVFNDLTLFVHQHYWGQPMEIPWENIEQIEFKPAKIMLHLASTIKPITIKDQCYTTHKSIRDSLMTIAHEKEIAIKDWK
jgi:hypothetical protein